MNSWTSDEHFKMIAKPALPKLQILSLSCAWKLLTYDETNSVWLFWGAIKFDHGQS